MARLPIDLSELSEAELVSLNHKIIERLRFLRDVKAHHHMQELRPGDQVSFNPEPGRKVTGTILRLNRKSVSLVDSSHVHWRVSPSLVSRVETKDVEIEITKHPSQPTEPFKNAGLRTLPLFETAPPADTPRNAPCPCGSGKKYKRCHLPAHFREA
jgi:hypothetical protein